MTSSSSNIFNEITTYRAFDIFLIDKDKEIILPDEHILDFELHWELDRFELGGYFKLNDVIDTMNSFDILDLNIKTYLNDLYDDKSFRKFKIIELKETKVNAQFKAIIYKFVDVISYELSNTYISKSYKDVTLQDIWEDQWKSLNLQVLLDEQQLTVTFKTDKVYDYLVIPNNMSLMQFFNMYLKLEGIKLIQTRNTIETLNLEKLNVNNLNKLENPFKDKDINSLYGNQIIDYKMSHQRRLELNEDLPNTTSYQYNFDSKNFSKQDISLEDVYNDISLNNLVNKFQSSTKKFQTNLNSAKTLFNAKNLITNSSLEILVPGNSKFNKILNTVEVVFKGNGNNIESKTKDDIKMSGNYLISKIIDKIILGKKFTQRITLNRVDYTKG